MARPIGWILLLALLAPHAAAAPEAALGNEADPFAPLRDAAANAGAAAADAGRAAANAAGSAASAMGAAFNAMATALGNAGLAIGNFLSSAASAIGTALSTLTAAVGAGLTAAASAITTGATALAALLASLATNGATYVRAHPTQSAIAAGSLASAGGLAWLVKRLGLLTLIPLYTRLAPSQMLDNEARHKVYDHVRAHPGVHPSAIADALDLGWGTVIYHLARLEGSSLVASRTSSHRKCYFATGSELGSAARDAVAAMSHDKAKLIVTAVRSTPGITQKELANRVGMSQALASWHVKRLVTSGVLLTSREGRSNALTVAAHVPDVTPPAAIAVAA